LLTPEMDRQFRYKTSAQEITFRWSEVENALRYVLQISQTRDFSAPLVSEQVQGTSFVSHEPEAGTWYWRVQPIFPPSYIGGAVFSNTAVFHISQNSALEPPVLNTPAADSHINAGPDRADLTFSWAASREAASYTIYISPDSDMRNSIITRTVRDNFFVYGRNENALLARQYFWSVSYTDEEGNVSPFAQPRPFVAVEGEVVQRLTFPPDSFTVEENYLQNTRFSWRTNLSFDKRLQVSSSPDFSRLEVDEIVTDDFFLGVSLPEGEWYWRLSAKQNLLSPVYNTPARHIVVTPAQPIALSAAILALLPQSAPDPQPAPEPQSAPPEPAPTPQSAAALASAPAVRPAPPPPVPAARPATPPRPSARPAPRQPAQQQPASTPQSAAQPQAGQARTPPPVPRQPPPLPPPKNLEPPSGQRIGAAHLRERRNIVFSWDAVEGANSYLLTIYQDNEGSQRQQIYQINLYDLLNFTFDELGLLNHNGTYIWQVEAFYLGRDGIIERRGQTMENTLVLDVARPARVRTREPGVLYGN